MRILAVTSQWPSPDAPNRVPFLVEHIDRLRRGGHSVDVFAFEGKKDPVRYARAWWTLRRRLTGRRYDLIHAHWGQSGLVALRQGLPVVVTLRGSDVQGIAGSGFGPHTVLGAALKLVTRYVAPRATAVVAVSPRLVRLLPGNVRAWIIPSGMELDLFRPVDQAEARTALGLPPNKRLVLFASDPQRPEKRHALAKEAVERAAAERDVELVVASNVPHSSMPLYFSACDALILTSTHEGSPNVVKEALANGLPVVSTDVGDVAEVVSRLESCRVTTDASAAKLAKCLIDVLDCGRRAENMVAAEVFSGPREVQRLETLYVDVLRRRGPA